MNHWFRIPVAIQTRSYYNMFRNSCSLAFINKFIAVCLFNIILMHFRAVTCSSRQCLHEYSFADAKILLILTNLGQSMSVCFDSNYTETVALQPIES